MKRSYTQKDGTIWEWEETPELIQILKELHAKRENDGKEIN